MIAKRISFKYFHDILQMHVRVTYRWVLASSAFDYFGVQGEYSEAHPVILEVERITDSGSIPLLGKTVSDDDEELLMACAEHFRENNV